MDLSYLDTVLRDQFVCGLKDQRIQQELLCIDDLALTKALDKSRSMEVVLKETQSIQELENSTAKCKPEDAAAHSVHLQEEQLLQMWGDGPLGIFMLSKRIKLATPVENWVTYPKCVGASCQQDIIREMPITQLEKHI